MALCLDFLDIYEVTYKNNLNSDTTKNIKVRGYSEYGVATFIAHTMGVHVMNVIRVCDWRREKIRIGEVIL